MITNNQEILNEKKENVVNNVLEFLKGRKMVYRTFKSGVLLIPSVVF